jgi:hypothetical protein
MINSVLIVCILILLYRYHGDTILAQLDDIHARIHAKINPIFGWAPPGPMPRDDVAAPMPGDKTAPISAVPTTSRYMSRAGGAIDTGSNTLDMGALQAAAGQAYADPAMPVAVSRTDANKQISGALGRELIIDSANVARPCTLDCVNSLIDIKHYYDMIGTYRGQYVMNPLNTIKSGDSTCDVYYSYARPTLPNQVVGYDKRRFTMQGLPGSCLWNTIGMGANASGQMV